MTQTLTLDERIAALERERQAEHEAKTRVVEPPHSPQWHRIVKRDIALAKRQQEIQEKRQKREEKLGLPEVRAKCAEAQRLAWAEREGALAELNAKHQDACQAVEKRFRAKHDAAQTFLDGQEAKL